MSHDSHKMVLGIFHDHSAAEKLIDALSMQGYSTDDVNVLMSEQTHNKHYPQTTEQDHENGFQDSLSLEGAGVGGAIGTAVGASLAAIAAIGTSLVIPGLNLVLAGPIAAAFAGGGAGAVTGGVIGGLAGLGFCADNADIYHRALREGGTIVGVTLHENENSAEEATTVMNLMKSFAGDETHVSCC